MSSSEMLRSDLRAIYGALGEVLSFARPDVPSWRFPGRLSASLALDDLLSPEARQEDLQAERRTLLEGVVDRLLLLLQASLKLWHEADGRHSQPLPLSLSSAVKKFCRHLLQMSRKSHNLSAQLKAKDEQISSLAVALSESQEQCQLLQTTLEQATSSHSRPSSMLTSVVPYEARSTLKLNRIHSSQSDRQSVSTDEPKAISLTSAVQSPATNRDQTEPKCATVSTQTAETTFAMCVRCSSTLRSLTLAAGRLQDLCVSLHLPSRLSKTDWEREAESGTLDPGKWGEEVETDIEAIERVSRAKEEELASLRESLAEQSSQGKMLNSQLSHLSLQLNSLQERSAESERSHVRQLSSCREAGSAQLREMEAAWIGVQGQRNRLEEQLARVQNERDKLKISSTEIERQQRGLQAELEEVRERERSLCGCQEALQGQLVRLQGELDQCREEMDNGRLQSSKTSVLNQTLQRKHQAGLSRQREVLQRLEEMDREAEDMRRELASTCSARDQLACRVEELQTECSSLQSQVVEHENKLATSAREQQRLGEELTGLELQLTSLSAELEKERENCRLLVTHPEQGCSPASGRDLQKHISANTIRILLLEEQNSEFRETMTQQARLTEGKRGQELRRPVPLWHSGSVVSALLSRGTASDDLVTRPPLLPAIRDRLKRKTSPASS